MIDWFIKLIGIIDIYINIPSSYTICVILNYSGSFQRMLFLFDMLYNCHWFYWSAVVSITQTNQGYKDDENQHTHWFSVQLQVSAKRPECSSGGQTTAPQRILVCLDNTHIQLTLSAFCGGLRYKHGAEIIWRSLKRETCEEMFDDELPDGRNKLFFCQTLSGFFTQEPANQLRPQTQTQIGHY